MLDSLGMWDAALALPEQVARAAETFEQGIDGLPERERVGNILAIGMGGSGIAGDVLSVVAGPFVPVPITVSKDYELPGFVGERTLVFALSFSGNSEEVVEGVTEAAALGAHVVMVCEGGELAGLAADWGRPVLPIPPGIPMPRAGLGALAVPPLLALEQIGLFPGARGVGAGRDRAALAAPRPARSRGQPRRRAGPSHRTHDPARLRRRPHRRRGRDAVEVRRQREREGARVLQPGAGAVPQRGGGVGPARRRDAAGAHDRQPPPRPRAPPPRPVGSSS